MIHGKDFVAVKTTYQYEYAAPGRKAGSRWTQLIVFPKGERFFVLMDKIDSVNDSKEMFLRNDTPGCIRHEKGDTFSEIYLSYLSGPKWIRIPSTEFFTPFPPDLKFGYRRDTLTRADSRSVAESKMQGVLRDPLQRKPIKTLTPSCQTRRDGVPEDTKGDRPAQRGALHGRRPAASRVAHQS